MRDLKNRLLFRPGIIGMAGNPFYLNRSALYRYIAEHAGDLGGRVLDVGCGTQPYRHLLTRATSYIGLEYDTPHARARNVADRYYTGISFPCENCEFDSVLATEVLEHVFSPDNFLREINRCLKDGGALVMTVPFLWDEHEQPFDYARYTSFGLRHLLEKNGFTVVQQAKLNVGAVALCQLSANYIYKVMHVRRRRHRFVIAAVLCAPLNLVGVLARALFRRPDDIYMSNVIVATKCPTW